MYRVTLKTLNWKYKQLRKYSSQSTTMEHIDSNSCLVESLDFTTLDANSTKKTFVTASS